MVDETGDNRISHIHESRLQDQFGDDVFEIIGCESMVCIPGTECLTCPGCRFPKIGDQYFAAGFKYPAERIKSPPLRIPVIKMVENID